MLHSIGLQTDKYHGGILFHDPNDPIIDDRMVNLAKDHQLAC